MEFLPYSQVMYWNSTTYLVWHGLLCRWSPFTLLQERRSKHGSCKKKHPHKSPKWCPTFSAFLVQSVPLIGVVDKKPSALDIFDAFRLWWDSRNISVQIAGDGASYLDLSILSIPASMLNKIPCAAPFTNPAIPTFSPPSEGSTTPGNSCWGGGRSSNSQSNSSHFFVVESDKPGFHR